MAAKRQWKRIVWAVDPFTDNPSLNKRSLAAIKAFTHGTTAAVYPAYILVPDRVDTIASAQHLLWMKTYRKNAEDRLKRIARDAGSLTMRTAKVLENRDGSQREAVNQLIKYAKSVKADVIAVSSHSRKGLSRMLLGSFAETLLHNSPMPVIVTNPGTSRPAKTDHILFPTDFSDASHKAFPQVVALAKQRGAKLTLFHKTASELEPFITSGIYSGGAYIPPKMFYQQQREKVREELQHWVKLAEDKGVVTTFVVSERLGSAGDAITAVAKRKNIRLIAMSTQSGPVESFLLGSTAKNVIRSATAPVLLLPVRSTGKKSQSATSKRGSLKSLSRIY